MITVTKEELTNLINIAFDAVNESKVGPLFTKTTDGSTVYVILAKDAFTCILSSIAPKFIINETSLKEKKEPWEE